MWRRKCGREQGDNPLSSEFYGLWFGGSTTWNTLPDPWTSPSLGQIRSPLQTGTVRPCYYCWLVERARLFRGACVTVSTLKFNALQIYRLTYCYWYPNRNDGNVFLQTVRDTYCSWRYKWQTTTSLSSKYTLTVPIVRLSFSLSICQFMYTSICPSIRLSTNLFAYLSLYMSVYVFCFFRFLLLSVHKLRLHDLLPHGTTWSFRIVTSSVHLTWCHPHQDWCQCHLAWAHCHLAWCHCHLGWCHCHLTWYHCHLT